jgi:hypothetical protein
MLTRQRFNRPVGISVFPDMVAWYAGAYSLTAPAIPRLVDSTEPGFILKHQAYLACYILAFQLIDSGVNFFEASMTSGLAFLG